MAAGERPDRMRQSMHGAQALLERRRAHRGGDEHMAARLEIVGVGEGALQPASDQPHPFGGDAVGKGVEAGCAIGLEAVGQGVHAGGGGDVGREADGELGIENHQTRHHPWVEDDLLHARRFVEDHPGAADFRSGSGRGWHRDHRGDPAFVGPSPPILLVLEIPERPILSRHEGDHLADVERAAAAERDDAVVTAVGKGGEAELDIGPDRIRVKAREQAGGETGRLVARERLADHRQLGEARIGDQQRPLQAELAAGRRQLGDPAGPEADRGRIVPVGARRGHAGPRR
jgi:hypothetical protein